MKKGSTIKSAIITVLQEENKPLRVKEIYNRIVEDDLYRFRAANPEHIVRTLLRRHSVNIDFPSAKKIKYFVFLEDGTFWIKGIPHKAIVVKEFNTELNESSQYSEIMELHKKYIANFKKTILKQLSIIDPIDFEFFCKQLLTAYGFKNMKITQQTKDGGIDGYGELKIGLATLPVAFECKRWSKTIGRPKISQFRGDIQGRFQQGVFFTTSRFSPDAKNASFQAGAAPVVLIDGAEIVKMMIEKEFGIEKEMLPLYTNALDLILQKE